MALLHTATLFMLLSATILPPYVSSTFLIFNAQAVHIISFSSGYLFINFVVEQYCAYILLMFPGWPYCPHWPVWQCWRWGPSVATSTSTSTSLSFSLSLAMSEPHERYLGGRRGPLKKIHSCHLCDKKKKPKSLSPEASKNPFVLVACDPSGS